MSFSKKTPLDQVPLQPRFPLKETLIAAAALFGAGLLAYSSSFAGQFIFDDDYFFVDFFTKNFGANQLWKYLATPNSLSRPVVSLSLAANYAVSGLEVWSYHIFNLAVHLLAALTLFSIVRRTLRLDGLRARFDAAAGWLALAVALLWLVHPLQTESVTYIWQRCESLAGLFYLLTLYCVMRGAEAQQLAEQAAASWERELPARKRMRPGWPRSQNRWYALAIMACAVGMACKATLVTAPVVVFAYDRIFLAKEAAAALRKRRGLYAGLAATWLILAALIFILPPNTIASFDITTLTPAAYAQTQCGVILHYLRLSFWPAGLCFATMWPAAHGLDEILPGALVVGTLCLATLWAWVRRPAWSFLGVWFFVILAPTSSFLPFTNDLVYEHRMYLSLAAVVALAVVSAYMLGAAFLRRLSVSKARRRTLGGLAAAGAIVTVAMLLGYLTYQRNTDYHDRLAMWRGVLKQWPDNWRAQYNVGVELSTRGKHEEAIEYFNKSLELNPRFEHAYFNRGVTRWKKGDYDGALADYNKTLELNPCFEYAYFNRGVTRWKKGDYDGALADYTKALELNPRFAEAYNNRGVAREKNGDHDGAAADYTKALELNPRYTEAYNNRGNLRRDRGGYDGALADYTKALELNPHYAEACYNRGMARQEKGDNDGALADYTKALEFNPRYAAAYNNRGGVRAQKGDCAGAIADFTKAVDLEHSNWQAWMNKGLLLVKIGKEDEAQACFAEGLKINPSLQSSLAGNIAQMRAERQALLTKAQAEK